MNLKYQGEACQDQEERIITEEDIRKGTEFRGRSSEGIAWRCHREGIFRRETHQEYGVHN